MGRNKNQFKIFYSNPALNDLENILNYLNQHSTSAAKEFRNYSGMEDLIDNLIINYTSVLQVNVNSEK